MDRNGTVDGDRRRLVLDGANSPAFIGNGGNGTFNVLSGGTLTANADSFIGYSAGSTGTLNVDGAGSKFFLTNNKSLFVGGSGLSGAPSGTGIVNVTNGGELDMNGSVTFLGVSGGTGTMNFDDANWNPGSAVAVGFSGTGIVNIVQWLRTVQLNGSNYLSAIAQARTAPSRCRVPVRNSTSIALVDRRDRPGWHRPIHCPERSDGEAS